MERWEEYEGGSPRAPRFALGLPLQYRPAGDVAWRKGHSANISRSGLLFSAEQPLHLETAIEVSFVVPVQVRGEPRATVICQGHVVRQVTPQGRLAGAALAATIEAYRFERDPALLP